MCFVKVASGMAGSFGTLICVGVNFDLVDKGDDIIVTFVDFKEKCDDESVHIFAVRDAEYGIAVSNGAREGHTVGGRDSEGAACLTF